MTEHQTNTSSERIGVGPFVVRVRRFLPRPAVLIALSVIILGAVFAVDLRTAHGPALGVPYLVAIALSAGVRGVGVTMAMTGAACAMTVLGYLWSPSGGDPALGLINHGLAFGAIGLVGILVIDWKRRGAERARAARNIARLVAASPNATLLMDRRGCIALVNDAAEALFGYHRDELLGRPVEVLIPPRLRGAYARGRAALPARGGTLWLGSERPLVLLAKGGEELSVEVGLTRLRTEDGVYLLSTVADVSKRQVREAAARAHLAARLKEAVVEEERRRLARELHDVLGQALTALKLDAVWLSQHLPASESTLRSRALAMEVLASTTIETVRRLAAALRPTILDDCGFVDAVRWQVGECERRTGLRCSVLASAALDAEGGWSDEQRTAAFRILQEALTNIARHAQASAVTVSLQRDGRDGVLQIRDDGRGITEREATRPEAIGVDGMRERAEMHGGTFAIAGSPGRGTTVTLRLPLNAAAGSPAAGEAALSTEAHVAGMRRR